MFANNLLATAFAAITFAVMGSNPGFGPEESRGAAVGNPLPEKYETASTIKREKHTNKKHRQKGPPVD